MVSSVGSGSLTVEVVMAVSVQSRASCSGILVNSDFTSKDTSLWSSGICAVLIASIKFSVDCSLCLDFIFIQKIESLTANSIFHQLV